MDNSKLMTNKNKYDVVSLFSGCGGLDLGIANVESDVINTDIKDSPFRFIWSNDALEHACKSLSKKPEQRFHK